MTRKNRNPHSLEQETLTQIPSLADMQTTLLHDVETGTVDTVTGQRHRPSWLVRHVLADMIAGQDCC